MEKLTYHILELPITKNLIDTNLEQLFGNILKLITKQIFEIFIPINGNKILSQISKQLLFIFSIVLIEIYEKISNFFEE